MSCIHYKFKSSLDYRTVTFDGLHLSLCELKRMIFDRERIRASDFDLLVTNAQTNEVYEGETAVVVRNSSVIVSRIPVEAQRKLPKIWDRGTDGVVPKTTAADTPSSLGSPVKRLSAYSEALSEEEKLKKMEEESTSDYDPSRYRRKNLIASGVPPPNYICNRCNQPGHWIKMCPSLNIKRTTGIPKGELMETTPDDPQAMLTSAGTYAVPVLHKQAFLMGKAEKPFAGYRVGPVQPAEPKKQEHPPELLCAICDNLLRDASLIPCCGYSYCDECIRHCLLESEDRECPHCHEKGVSPTSLIPNGKLREAVKAFQSSMKNPRRSPSVEDLPSKTTPAITASPQSRLRVNLAQLVACSTVIVSSDQQTVPTSASLVDTTVQPVSTSVDDGSTETKPTVSTVSSSSDQQTVQPSNATFSTVYPGMTAMVPTNPYITSFSPLINPMQSYSTGMPLAASPYSRGIYATSNMSQLVGGMYPSGACQIPDAYMRFYMKEAMRRSGRPTRRDEWEEFLARKDRRRRYHRSKSPPSRSSRRARSRSTLSRSPHRRHHDSGERLRDVRPPTESPRHRHERSKPSLPPPKSHVSPSQGIPEGDEYAPVKENLERDDSGLVSIESLTSEADINEMLWESVSCDYDSPPVKSPKRADRSSRESVGKADTPRPYRGISPDAGDGRTTLDDVNMFDRPPDGHFGHMDMYEAAEHRGREKIADRPNEQLWDNSRSSPVIDLFGSFGDESVEEDGGPQPSVYERRDSYRRSPSLQQRHRPNFKDYRDGQANDFERGSMMPPASYHEYGNRSHRRAVAGRSERRRDSWNRDTVREEHLNYASRSEMFNQDKALDSYGHMPFGSLEQSSTFASDRLAGQEKRTYEDKCPSALPASRHRHREKRKEKKTKHSKKLKKEKKHKKKKSKDKHSSSSKKKRRHHHSDEPKEISVADMPHVLDSTEWVVQESTAPEPSSASDACRSAPVASRSLHVAAAQVGPLRPVSKDVSSSTVLNSKLPRSVDNPLSSNVGKALKHTTTSSRTAAALPADKLKSKHSEERDLHQRADDNKASGSKCSAPAAHHRESKEVRPEQRAPKSAAHSNKKDKGSGKSASETHRHTSSGHVSSHSRGQRPTASTSSNSQPKEEAKASTEKKRDPDPKADKQTAKRRIVYNEESPRKTTTTSMAQKPKGPGTTSNKVRKLEAVFEVNFGNQEETQLPIARGGHQYNPIMEPAKPQTSTVVPKPIKLKRDWVAITAAASQITADSKGCK